jgi:outer membrane OprD family porin
MIESRDRRGPTRAWRGFAATLVLVLSAAGGLGPAWAEDDPPPPPTPLLEMLFKPLKAKMADLPPFIRDTDFRLHFRTYYFNREKPDGTENEAWAFGGWASYQSGWLFDTFAMGATLYGSAPLYAPDDKDGTLLLKPGQEGYYVPGEAWGALRYKDYALLKGYRQLVDQPYINPQDNRMTPNTFEGVTLGGKAAWVQYFGGYLWDIKPRNADDFISMSEQAGAAGTDRGVALAGVRLTPIPGLRLDLANQYGIDTFNTIYGEADYLFPLNADWKLRFGAQFTDQRAVGDKLLTNVSDRDWNTQNGSSRFQAIFRELTLTAGFSITASGNTIQSPWGSFPGYLSLIDQDFDRANEKAVLFGAAYDFSKVLVQGLSAYFNFAAGWDAINPQTRADAPDQREYDLTIDYRPAFKTPAFLQGMWLRVRGAILDQESAKELGWQVRLILNWERDLF